MTIIQPSEFGDDNKHVDTAHGSHDFSVVLRSAADDKQPEMWSSRINIRLQAFVATRLSSGTRCRMTLETHRLFVFRRSLKPYYFINYEIRLR